MTRQSTLVLVGTDRDVRPLMKMPAPGERNEHKAAGGSDISVSLVRTSWRVHLSLRIFAQQDAFPCVGGVSATDRDVRTATSRNLAKVRTSRSDRLTQSSRQFGHLGQHTRAGTDISASTRSDISANLEGQLRTSRPVLRIGFGHLGQFLGWKFGHLGQFGRSTVGQDRDFASCLMMIILFIHHYSFFNHMTSTSALP